jgi:hypothetical protein
MNESAAEAELSPRTGSEETRRAAAVRAARRSGAVCDKVDPEMNLGRARRDIHLEA